jgi:hypothetical protein
MAYTGLGLPRDPSAVGAAGADVLPFHPVTLDPGEGVPVVVAAVAGRCADPNGEIRPTSETITSGNTTTTRYYYGPGITVVYEFLGWRIEDEAQPPLEVVVPTREGCQ